MDKFQPLLDHNTPWVCYRSNKNNNLVYFSCNKCASTFYDKFYKELGWEKITTADINWSTNFVLSYIRDPVVRHRKGIVEGIFAVYPLMKKVFLNDFEKLKFLANVTSVEAHSYSIYRMLGFNATKIHWIPIDTDLDHKQETLKILSYHNENVNQGTVEWFLSLPRDNESTVEEIEFYNQLRNISTPPEILRHLDFDICLYNKSITPEPHTINPKIYTAKIQELRNKGLTQEEAEKIVDIEIFDYIDRKQKLC
jgi:hypothetical protein